VVVFDAGCRLSVPSLIEFDVPLRSAFSHSDAHWVPRRRVELRAAQPSRAAS
jgi:hypothetical protein